MSNKTNTLGISPEPIAHGRRGLLKLTGMTLGAASLLGGCAQATSRAGASPVLAAATAKAPSAEQPVRINYNENPLGMSPKARQAAIAGLDLANRYPRGELDTLRQRLAQHHGVPSNHVLLTDGSGEGIRATMAMLAVPGAQLVIPELTYGDGEAKARVYGMQVNKVKSHPDWSFDLPGLQSAVRAHKGSSVVYIVNPNNPTATVTPSEPIESWVKSRPANTVFIIDEAYSEFVNDPRFRSADHLVAAGADNVIVLKTFSKIHAMAGMRVGYIVAAPQQLAAIARQVTRENVGFPSVLAAQASMDDTAFLEYSKRTIDTSRAIYTQVLDELKLQYLPSQANFVFHRISGSLKDFQSRMAEAHVRVGRAFPPADGWCRVSLGTPEEMRYVAQTLREFRQRGWV